MPSSIFRYLATIENPITNKFWGTFDGVCSPIDLVELPENSPLPGQDPPFFRKASVDLVFRSKHDGELAIQKILEHVQNLVNALDSAQMLATSDGSEVVLLEAGEGSFSSSLNFPSLPLPSSIGRKPQFQVVIRRQVEYEAGRTQGYRIHIQIRGLGGLPSKVFRYLAVLENPLTNTVVGTLDGVCSPVDLEILPENAPLVGQQPPFFRKAEADLVFRSREDAEEALQEILQHLQSLANALTAERFLSSSGQSVSLVL
jgi:hypothetical protein